MSSHHHPRTACIIDGDNLTMGGALPVPEVAGVMRRLSRLTDGMPVTFAMQRKLAANYMTAYAGLGWGLHFASMEPDAADIELLDAAADYVRHDVTDLVVASGDHAFADIARRARLHVCSYRSSLSRRLQMAATTVTYLDDLLVPAAA